MFSFFSKNKKVDWKVLTKLYKKRWIATVFIKIIIILIVLVIIGLELPDYYN